MLLRFGDYSSFHALGSFEDYQLVGFFFFSVLPFAKVNTGFGADGRWDTKRLGLPHGQNVTTSHGCLTGWSACTSCQSRQERISFSCSFFDDQKMPSGIF